MQVHVKWIGYSPTYNSMLCWWDAWSMFDKYALISFLANLSSKKAWCFQVANTCQNAQTCVFKRPLTLPRPLIFCIAILSLFFVVIALFKVKTSNSSKKKKKVFVFRQHASGEICVPNVKYFPEFYIGYTWHWRR